MTKTTITSIELPSEDVAQSKQFYGSLFGWSFEDFGSTYTSFSDSGDHESTSPLRNVREV